MAEEIKKIITVDVSSANDNLTSLKKNVEESGQSFQSMRDAKKYIDNLQASLFDLKEDSKEYKKRIEDIRGAQDKLNNILKQSSSSAASLEGSYNSLQQKLNELKKQWRETNDEGTRNNLGEQILKINNQLKDMDGSIGNFQRNVGNYQGAFTSSFRDIANSIDVILPGAGQAYTIIEKIVKGIQSIFGLVTARSAQETALTGQLGAQQTSLSGQLITETGITAENQKQITLQKLQNDLTSINAEYTQNSLKIAHKENELRTKTHTDYRKKIQSEIDALNKKQAALINERELTAENIKLVKNQNTATKVLTTTTKGLSTVVKGIGSALLVTAVISGITLLIKKIKEHFDKLKEIKQAQIDFKKELYATKSGAAENITAIQVLAEKYKKLGDNINDKNKFIKENKEYLEKTGLAINNVNDADDVFINNTTKYIQALTSRAQAQGAYNLLVKANQEQLEKNAEYDAKIQQIYDDNTAKLNDLIEKRDKNLAEGNEYTAKQYQNAIDALNKSIKKQIKPINDERDKFNAAQENKKKTYLNFAEAVKNANKDLSVQFSTNTFEADKTPEPIKPIKRLTFKADTTDLDAILNWQKTFYNNGLTPEQLDLDKLEETYQEALNLFREYGIDTAELEEYFNKQRNDIIDKYDKERQDKAKEDADKKLTDLDRYYELERDIADKTIINEEDRNIKLAELERDRVQARIDAVQEILNNDDLSKEAREEYVNELIRLNAQLIESNKNVINAEDLRTKKIIEEWTNVVDALGDLFSNIADLWENSIQRRLDANDISQEEAEKEFEKQKDFQIATAVINGLGGISAALSSPIANAMGPAGWIAAGIQAASIGVSTALQIAKIKQTTLTSSSGTNLNSTPKSEAVAYNPTYSKNITGKSENEYLQNAVQNGIKNGQQDIRVYVLESDIRNAGTKVNVRETETRF